MANEDNTIARLGSACKTEPAFLATHHIAAAMRLEGLIRRALLSPRLTMFYDPASTGGGPKSAGNAVAEMTDTAAEARQKLNRLAAKLSPDCWNVAFDVCGMGKGLQTIETERAWPRRSAKLVLRIALDQLADHFGLAPHVAPHRGAATTAWLGTRLPLIEPDERLREEPR